MSCNVAALKLCLHLRRHKIKIRFCHFTTIGHTWELLFSRRILCHRAVIVKMKILLVGVTIPGVHLVRQNIQIRLYVNHLPVHIDTARKIHVAELPRLCKFRQLCAPEILFDRLGKLRALPGILADGKRQIIHRDRIVSRRILVRKTLWSRHVGIPAAVHQHILAVNNQINVQLIGMSVPRSHRPGMQMQKIGTLRPVRPEIGVPAVLQEQRCKVRFSALHPGVFFPCFHAEIPDTLIIKTVESTKPQHRI